MLRNSFSPVWNAEGGAAGGDASTPGDVPGAPPAGIEGAAGGDAGGDADWRASLPEEIRDHKSLRTIKDVAALAKSYVNQQPLLGADKIIKPADDAPAAEWDNFWTNLGVPAQADGYTLPEGIEADDKLQTAFQRAAHQAKLLPQQAQNMAKYFAEEAIAYENERKAEGITALKSEWGGQFDANAAAAASVVEKLFGQEFKDFLFDSATGNDARMIKGFHHLSTLLSEDNFDGGSAGSIKTADDWDKMADDIMDNKDNPHHAAYWSGVDSPEKREAVKMINEYRKKAVDLRGRR